jgi:hypothetical protein
MQRQAFPRFVEFRRFFSGSPASSFLSGEKSKREAVGANAAAPGQQRDGCKIGTVFEVKKGNSD